MKVNTKLLLISIFLTLIWYAGACVAFSLELFLHGPHWLAIFLTLPIYIAADIGWIFFGLNEDTMIVRFAPLILLPLLFYGILCILAMKFSKKR